MTRNRQSHDRRLLERQGRRPHRRRSLYTGPFHRSCVRTALALVAPERVWIVSARYGLVPYDLEIELDPFTT